VGECLDAKRPGVDQLIYQYLRKYQEDPNSKVFAPLAEAYRKAGLLDEAIEIAREGLTRHPDFVGGKVALARALFDKRQYPEVIDVLQNVIREVPDNLMAQRLAAESFLILGEIPEALACYKMLLFFKPEDSELSTLVAELEAQAYHTGQVPLQIDAVQGFRVVGAETAMEESPEAQRRRWMTSIERLQNVLPKIEAYRWHKRNTLFSQNG
jgi:tetratricopeptide (TPR) repeat protein